MEYIIAVGWDTTSGLACMNLIRDVNHYLEAGFEPIGGISIVYDTSTKHHTATQAMIKKG